MFRLGQRGPGGLAAILAEEVIREAVYETPKARRIYSTSGPNPVCKPVTAAQIRPVGQNSDPHEPHSGYTPAHAVRRFLERP